MIHKQIREMLQSIHAYYPVGMSAMSAEYPGTLMLKEGIETKINDIIEGKITPWSSLVDSIQKEFETFRLDDRSYIQLPAYSLRIILEEVKSEDVTLERSLNVNISLLCNYFTCYFEDWYIFHLAKESSRGVSPDRRFFYARDNKKQSSRYVSHLEMLKMEVEKYFSEHTFIPHSALFAKIEGCPPWGIHPEEAERFYPIFFYLFDNSYSPDSLEILD